MKTTSCNGKIEYAFNKAPRCHARTKSNNGKPCQAPAVNGKHRCRMHGGAKSSGAQPRNRNALKHGLTSKEFKHLRKSIRKEIRSAKKFWENFIN